MTIYKEINVKAPLTEKQKKMIEDLTNRPVQCDEDCPELPAEQLSHMVRAADKNIKPQGCAMMRTRPEGELQ